MLVSRFKLYPWPFLELQTCYLTTYLLMHWKPNIHVKQNIIQTEFLMFLPNPAPTLAFSIIINGSGIHPGVWAKSLRVILAIDTCEQFLSVLSPKYIPIIPNLTTSHLFSALSWSNLHPLWSEWSHHKRLLPGLPVKHLPPLYHVAHSPI